MTDRASINAEIGVAALKTALERANARIRELESAACAAHEAHRAPQARNGAIRDQERTEISALLVAGKHVAIKLAGTYRAAGIDPHGCQALSEFMRAAKALEAERAQDDWRTMDSAPRDGQTFLALIRGQVRLASYCISSIFPAVGFCIADQGAEGYARCEPTRWRPLPAAPKEPSP